MAQNMDLRFQNRSAASARALDADEPQDASRSLRALLVLDYLARAQHPPTLAQLAQRLDMPKSTLMRLLAAMQRAGFVAATPTENGFVPGPQATALALSTLHASAFTRACRAVLAQLVGKLGETCNLTAPDGDQVIYMERVETTEPLRLFFAVGSHVPMHCTASGKLFLASMSRLERGRVLARLPLTRNTPRTLTDPARLEDELERLATRGIGIDNEEFVRGMSAVAVPVRDAQDRVVAAVACHAPTARLMLDDLLRAVPVLQGAAQSMRAVLAEHRPGG
ncbi:IclR family transcriptional regulator [Achromobacter ruhlandii]|uniref:IclR family transcriptional regulator n=1 Tax=Achromobacter ruhlandii TaxID=72557 RepID=UPI0006BFB5B8|nr:IclR family transcriptional regulator [Achromobacter ruhlandii]AVC42950.1 IclR family transcriptional regulator [Achromobacter xylosoxidans]CUI66846.1 Pectin degradation repressor protein kdgR [Achromobacter ruhlandii]CUJ04849.1 Pectin degradation repressor protein kdgR [Achromobacter ruhlandii]CUK15217.1 Pectin degradation repressor protein kdgR [Achromobacter ruhlandii]